ncbi:MAG: hypothetical protein P4L80_02685 [Xanthobacteraceae bacterium]|nr:hypothetical protein [Xanthobacteraceae bacterium]
MSPSRPTRQVQVGKAATVVDPIFSAIAKHKTAVDTYAKAIHNYSELEDALPSNRRKTDLSKHRNVVKTDDPRWIKAEKQVDQTGRAMDAAAMKVLRLKPKTLQGAIATLRHMLDHIDHYHAETMGWPDGLLPDDVNRDPAKLNFGHGAGYFLMQNVAAGLERLRG